MPSDPQPAECDRASPRTIESSPVEGALPWRLIAELAVEPIVIVDWTTGRIVDANCAACEPLGYSPQTLRGRLFSEIAVEPAPSRWIAELRRAGVSSDHATTLPACHRLPNGQRIVFEWRMQSMPEPNPTWVVAMASPVGKATTTRLFDATGSKDAPREAAGPVVVCHAGHSSESGVCAIREYDALTGLPNRSRFEESLSLAMIDAAKESGAFSVLFVDLDDFKSVNDRWGHLLGDRVLRQIAHRLQSSVRPDDLLTRFGGDEFTILVRHVADPANVFAIAKRIHDGIAVPIEIESKSLAVTASIGIATSRQGYATAADLLHAADRAMYVAKSQGRSRSCLAEAGGVLPLSPGPS
jgi:diguanylate cyclase (GGDEF)-like protein/PAS domain S-box-containing protein